MTREERKTLFEQGHIYFDEMNDEYAYDASFKDLKTRSVQIGPRVYLWCEPSHMGAM